MLDPLRDAQSQKENEIDNASVFTTLTPKGKRRKKFFL